jgi:hypothetical protein
MRQGATSTHFFWLAAASMILLGTLVAATVRLTDWGPKAAGLPA